MLATEQLKRSEVLRSNHRCFGRLLLLRFLFALIYSMGLPCSTLYSDPPDSAESKAQNESVKAYIRNFTPSGQTVVVGEKPRTPQESQQSFIVAQGLRIDLALIEEMNVLPDFRAPNNIRLGITPLYTTYADIYETVRRLAEVVERRLYETYDAAPEVT